MLDEDFTVQARLAQHLKDVRLILSSGVTLPLSETHRQLLERAEAMGLGEADNCAIIKAIQQCQE
jgi:3-hydroxyisobutyrate dehydrogenase-like beta-hydroxyacid dehydrogenase